MEAHGGYLLRLGEIDCPWLAALARAALAEEGVAPGDCSLLASLLPRQRVVRLAFDAPFTYGRKGAHWYEGHHALARRLSAELSFAVHAYVFDPDELEEVVAYGGGRRVGGERLRYEEVELSDDDDLNDFSFERLKARWPLGHLGKVLGVAREQLLHIARAQTVLLELDGSAPRRPLAELFGLARAQPAISFPAWPALAQFEET